MVHCSREGRADAGSRPEAPVKSRRCVRTSVRCVWAIAALSRPLLETRFGGLEPEPSLKGWKGCCGAKDLELGQICLPKGSFSLKSGN